MQIPRAEPVAKEVRSAKMTKSDLVESIVNSYEPAVLRDNVVGVVATKKKVILLSHQHSNHKYSLISAHHSKPASTSQGVATVRAKTAMSGPQLTGSEFDLPTHKGASEIAANAIEPNVIDEW